MSVTEHARNDLLHWFEEHMGEERAATMMSMLPPAGWADVATKRDLNMLAERVDMKIERLDTKFDVLAERMGAEFRLVRSDAKAELNELRSDLQRTFVTWILTAQATVVAAVGLLLVALR